MFEFGGIVFTRFPFTDLTGGKLRPALVVSGKLGDADPVWLRDAAPVFFRVFGFTLPHIPDS